MSTKRSSLSLVASLVVLILLIGGVARAERNAPAAVSLADARPVSGTALTRRQAADNAAGTVAYSQGDQIRLVGTDGKNDRRIWQTTLGDGATGIRGLQWRPDGGALAFGSGHQWLCSQYSRDIYTILADGSNFRRITNSPDCDALAGYPKGTVVVRLENASTESVFGLYVEGAPEAVLVTLSPGSAVDVTVPNVADLGDFAQAVTVISGGLRWIDPTVTVNVVPNQATTASNSFLLTGQGNVFSNVGASLPSWHRTGSKLGFIFYEGILEEISANPPISGSSSPLTSPGSGATGSFMAWSPVSDDILYAAADSINLIQPGTTDPGQSLITKDGGQLWLGLDWLPDGSGFVFAATGGQFGPENSNLYLYFFGDDQLYFITDYDTSFAGAMSVAPDGWRVVFEFSPADGEPAELWLVQLDGNGLAPLGVNGNYPDWRPGTGIDFTDAAYLPLIIRP